MTPSPPPAPPGPPDVDSLGACLRRVYALHFESGGTPREVLLTDRDWPRTVAALREALSRVGGRAWLPASGSPVDGGPALLASYDAARGVVRLRPAAEGVGYPRADRLDMDGRPLGLAARPPIG